MSESLEIQPAGPLRAEIRPPGSKSITNRALVCAALADGTSRLPGALDSDDTRVMVEALRRLGVAIDWEAAMPPVGSDANAPASRGRQPPGPLPGVSSATACEPSSVLVVHGCGGRFPATNADLFVGNSGTTVRFLAAVVALGNGRFRLDGTPRMRERPIRDLLDGLAQLGAAARSEADNGCPPLVVDAAGLPGGRATIRGDVSSQFLSGLLLAAPYARQGVELALHGPLVSQPYVRMTLAVMRSFGVAVETDDGLSRFRVPAGQRYAARDYPIEPDASAASYFLAAAAVAGGEVSVLGLSRDSLQGDVAFADLLAQMGCRVRYEADRITVEGRPLRGISVDMNAISDTVQTLAAVALFADGPTAISGVAHIRHKETDRIGALAIELRKLGAKVDERPDGLRIVPGALHGAALDTYDDHRMAMSLALVGLRVPGVVIRDPGCTAKTYPRYFDDLAAVCGT